MSDETPIICVRLKPEGVLRLRGKSFATRENGDLDIIQATGRTAVFAVGEWIGVWFECDWCKPDAKPKPETESVPGTSVTCSHWKGDK